MALRKSTSRRVRHLRHRHAKTLETLGRQQGMHARPLRTPDGFFDYVLAFDPTPKALYLQRIIQWLVDGTARLEDGRSIRDCLSRFHADKHRLPEPLRDIGMHASPGEVLRLFDANEDVRLRDVPAHVMEHCEVVGRGSNWSIVRVETPEAARWWADSTQWCTRHMSRSAEYLRRGSLYVLIVGKDRFQFHLHSRQFLDAWDMPFLEIPAAPDEAFEAVLAIAGGSSPEGVSYIRPGVAQVAEDILRSRAGDKIERRILMFPERPEWVSLLNDSIHIEHEPMDDRHARLIMAQSENSDPQDWLEPMSVQVRIAGRGVRRIGIPEIDAGHGDDMEHIEILLDFMRSGALRLSGGMKSDGVHPIEGDNELRYLSHHMLKPEGELELVASGGEGFLVRLREEDDVHQSLSIRDLRDGKHYLISDRWSLEALPPRVSRVVDTYHRHRGISGGLLVAVGAGILDAVMDDPIRLSDTRSEFLYAMAKAGRLKPMEADAVAEILMASSDGKTPALGR